LDFSEKYGPWALIAGASDGVGKTFAEALAARGLNVVLLARRDAVLHDVADQIHRLHNVQTRVLALDLSKPDVAAEIHNRVSDLEIGFLVYCAGADANFRPFLESDIAIAEQMLHRNCVVLTQLCHHFCTPMAKRNRGAVVIFGSGGGLAGAANMVTYCASKAFDMVFAEGLYCELKPKGVDVLGLILGETDTPSLRKLRHERGLAKSPDEPVKHAQSPVSVVNDALDNLTKGSTRMANKKMRWGLKLLFPISRNRLVSLMDKANQKVMGKG
jgi:uncharacterized protein